MTFCLVPLFSIKSPIIPLNRFFHYFYEYMNIFWSFCSIPKIVKILQSSKVPLSLPFKTKLNSCTYWKTRNSVFNPKSGTFALPPKNPKKHPFFLCFPIKPEKYPKMTPKLTFLRINTGTIGNTKNAIYRAYFTVDHTLKIQYFTKMRKNFGYYA